MDDIDTRLQAERPEVADALRSMNWQERLEEARSRRNAVLKEQKKSGKRPVVRIVDAAAMAQIRGGVLEPSEATPASGRIVRPSAPDSETRPPAAPAPLESQVRDAAAPEAAPASDRPSIAGRTALGFGVGLGLGTSVLAGAYLLFGLPYPATNPAREPTLPVAQAPAVATSPVTVPNETVAAASPAAVLPVVSQPVVSGATPEPMAAPAPQIAEAVRPTSVAVAPARRQLPAQPVGLAADAPPGTQSAAVPAVALSDSSLPVVATVAPTAAAVPADPIGEDLFRPSFPPSPARAEAPAQLSALSSDTFPTATGPAQAPVVAALDLVLGQAFPPPEALAASVPDPANAASRMARLNGASVVSPDAVPAWEGSAPRPSGGIAPAAFAGTAVAASSSPPLARFVAPLPVALPAQPAPVERPDGAFNLAFAPPAPPPPPLSVIGGESIPNGDTLFVRIAVPETVPEEEASELAGLLQEVGIGDGRINRVGFKVSETHIRFYHAEDAESASALGEIIGTEARDFTSFRPSPPDGTLEIFLAGDRTSPPPRVAAPKRARPQPPDEMTRMRDRIVNRLRRGEHL